MSGGLRIGVVCDYREEGWPSMDLVADLVLSAVAETPGLAAVRLGPGLARPLGTLFAGRRLAVNVDRALGRYLAYPRWLRRQHARADLFHVVDHSYAHLLHALPPGRAVVTCHDLDAFRSLLEPAAEPRPLWFRALSGRVLSGLRRAALVICDSATVAAELERGVRIDPARIRVVPLPVPPGLSPEPDAEADARAARLLGPGADPFVLHVGSTARRKRLDVLVNAVAMIRQAVPGTRLVRVGGSLPSPGGGHLPVTELPFLDRPTLAALYRRAAVVLLTSDREGFGLPLLEAMACGAPVVASDLPVLREVGGDAVRYAPAGDAAGFAARAHALMRAPEDARRAGIARAAAFSQARFAAQLEDVYRAASRAP